MLRRWHPVTLAGVLGVKKREIIAVYGGGGKTTLLNALAREIAGAGGSVILTTTTKIYPPQGIPVIMNPKPVEALQQLKQLLPYHPVVSLGSALLPEGKLVGVDPALLEELFRRGIASHYLVEADGAKGRPIKGYAPYEPVISPAAGLLIPVLGLDALGARVDEQVVHRPELFSLQSGAEMGEFLDISIFNHCLEFMIKRGKKLAPRARVMPVLNKMDLLHEGMPFRTVATALQEGIKIKGIERLIFSAARETAAVKFVLPCTGGPSVSCIVLAAGSAERMGRDKLLLPLAEKTILEHVVDNALQAAAVDEVILVTRPQSKKTVVELLRGKKVRVVSNPCHRKGMASSLQAGLSTVNPAAQAVIFALGDQPFVTGAVYDALISSYHKRWNLLTAPLYQGKRGNPVLLDRRTWHLVMELQGDTGGRELFSRVGEEEIALVEMGTPGIVQDIDTLEDYERFTRVAEEKQ
ncbi:MAG: selenium cofactor biosynthesis protein YqeC [Bacillota bacterium]